MILNLGILDKYFDLLTDTIIVFIKKQDIVDCQPYNHLSFETKYKHIERFAETEHGNEEESRFQKVNLIRLYSTKTKLIIKIFTAKEVSTASRSLQTARALQNEDHLYMKNIRRRDEHSSFQLV